MAKAVMAFFAEALKSDTAVYRMVTIDLLTEIGANVSKLRSEVATEGKEILSEMQMGFGPIGQAIVSVERRLDQFAANDRDISAKLDRILAVLTSVPAVEAEARVERWAASEYADYGLTNACVRDLIAENSKFFVGREGDLETLDDFLNEHDRGLLIVAAPAGVGKSALLAEWMGRRREVGDFVARHVIARRAPETVGSTAVLEHLLRQVSAYRGELATAIPDTESKLADAIFEHLKPAARAGERLIVVIDGLDEADASLRPFARREMGTGVYVVLGVRAAPETEPYVLKRWLSGGLGNLPQKRFDVKPLSATVVVQWLRAITPGIRVINELRIAEGLHRATDGVPLFLRFVIDDFARTLVDAGLEKASAVITSLPSSFTDYVRTALSELDSIEDGAWGVGPRKLFALLTQTLGPISVRELHEGKLTPPELNLRRLDHRIERWFSISGDGSERTFAFTHPLLATVFGAVLGDEADDAKGQLCAHCKAWSRHKGAYALAFAPDHLISAAEAEGWSSRAVEGAAEPLVSLEFHRARLALTISDGLMARAPQQMRRLSENADGQLAERLRIWAAALAEARPMVSIDALPDRDEAGRLLCSLIIDFSKDLHIAAQDFRLIKARLALRGQASPFFVTVFEGHQGWVLGALELSDGRLLSWVTMAHCASGTVMAHHLRYWKIMKQE